MARRNGPSRGPNQSGRNKQNRPQRAGDFDNLALNVQREQELDPRNALGYKKINLSKEVSDSTNFRVKLLLSGLQGLEKFTKENSEETSDFYQQNKEQIDGLLKIKLDELYQKLVTNSQKRKGFEEKLVTDKVISLQQLNAMRGIDDLQPYTNYINEISQEQQKAMQDYRKEVARINALPAPAPGAPANPPLPALPVIMDGNDLDGLLKARPRNFADIARRLKDEGKLTDQQLTRLTELSPKSEEEIQRTKEQIFIEIKKHDLQNGSGYFDQYQNILREEEELIGQVDQYQERYNTLVKGLVKQIQEMVDQDDYQKKRQKNLQKLRLRTGLPIKKGQILWGEDWSKDQTNFEVQRQHTNRIEIKDITYGVVEEDSELTPEFKQKVPTFEPIIHFTALAQDGSGQPIEYQMSGNAFRKWVIGNNVIEKFDSLADLEKSIGFPGLIKAGQTFEYVSYTLSTPGQAEPEQIKKTIKIEAVEGDLITLDQEVIIDYAVEGAGLRNPRVKKQLTFGEFSKWYGKNEAVPALDSLEKMNQFLSEHHRRLVAEMGWPENHGAPINLNTPAPFFLISAYYPEGDFIELKKVEPDKITLGDGTELSPADFLRFTISEGLIWPTQDQLKELKQIATAQKNEKKANQIEQVAKETPTAPSPAKTESTEIGDGPILGYFKNLWSDTTFLNLMEIYELFIKAPSDRVEEWLKDKSERKISKVGQDFYKGFPDFGGLSDLSSTYEDKLNGKIAGDVKGLEEFFEKNYDSAKVLEVMYGASDPTTLKACLQFLSKKGALRWEDDDKLHAVLNIVLKPAVYPSKFHQAVGGENVSVIVNHRDVLEKVETMSVFDQLEIRLDNHYGEGTY
ncbi:hypothetical protein IT412_03905, partial [Candidatus Peregrinibacteria bacterium]|nr:hypothetical protein [Candidatus Peregrinibacteria bacterium]